MYIGRHFLSAYAEHEGIHFLHYGLYRCNKLQHIRYGRVAANVDQSKHMKTDWFDGLGSCCAKESPHFSYPTGTSSCIGNPKLSLYHPKRSAEEIHTSSGKKHK